MYIPTIFVVKVKYLHRMVPGKKNLKLWVSIDLVDNFFSFIGNKKGLGFEMVHISTKETRLL